MITFEAGKIYKIIYLEYCWHCVDFLLGKDDCFLILKANKEYDRYEILVLIGTYAGKKSITNIGCKLGNNSEEFNRRIEEVSLKE